MSRRRPATGRRRHIGTPGKSKQTGAGALLRCNRCAAELRASRKCSGSHCRQPGCKGRLLLVEREAA